jgi:hypothetical protein
VQLCEFDRLGSDVVRRRRNFQANWDSSPTGQAVATTRFVLDTEPIRIAVDVLVTGAPEDDTQFEALTEPPRWPAPRPVSIRTRLDAVVRIAWRCHKAGRGGNKTKWKQHGGADALDALRTARVARPATG